LLGEDLRAGLLEHIHRFQMRDEQGRGLLDHGGIWILELGKFASAQHEAGGVDSELQRWLKFFTEAERLDEQALPEWMQTEEMQQAMSTLKAFSEKEREYHAYQARQNYLRQQRSIQRHLETLQTEAEEAQKALQDAQAKVEQARAAEEQARAAEEQALAVAHQAQVEKERERAEKEAALAEIERLRRLLEGKPDDAASRTA
jgi:hypothetical protein